MKTRDNSNYEAHILYCYRNYWKGSSVYEGYKQPSSYKVEAERNILKEMQALGGWGYRITGANSFSFSCGYFFNIFIDGAARSVFVYHSSSSCRLFFVGEVPWSTFKQTELLYRYRRALFEFESPAALYNEYKKLQGVYTTKIEKDGTARRLQFINNNIGYQDSLELHYVINLYNEIMEGRKKIDEYRVALWKQAARALDYPKWNYIPTYLNNIKGLQEYEAALEAYVLDILDARRAVCEIEQAAEQEAWSQYMDAIL